MTSIIKDGIYLDFSESITFRKEARKQDNISASYTVTYAFGLDLTNKNLDALGIVSVDQADKGIYQISNVQVKVSEIVINGKLRVEKITDKIECSFFTDNFDVFALFNGTIRDTKFGSYTYSFPNKNTSGFIDIPINNGTNRTTWNVSLSLNYLPSFYVKSIIKDMLGQEGIKLEGDILQDYRYNHLVITSNSPYIDYDPDYIFDKTIFVGKTANQSATGPGTTTITFTSETGTYYDNPNWWDGTNTFNPGITITVGFELNLLFDTSGAHTISIGGSASGVVFTQVISASDTVFLTDYFLGGNENFTVTIIPAAGTINVLPGSSFKVFPITTFDDAGTTIRANQYEILPRFIIPPIDKSEFIRGVFSIFNPILDFNPITKVLTVNFFENIKSKPEEDWSDYIESYEEDFIETLEGYGKKSFLNFDDPDDTATEQYNKSAPIPFGSGVLEVANDFISESEDILTIEFPPTPIQLNVAQQAYLPVFPFFPDEDILENRLLLADVFSVSDFSNKSSINSNSTLGYGWFAKQFVGKNIDNVKANLSFENPIGYQGIGVKDDYYRLTEKILNDPVKITALMRLPESVYRELDFSTPKRIKTKKFNSLFFCLSVEGWEASHLLCEVELIKL